VFTPSILTILGIILFLRLGFVVGQAGLAWALVIILLANAISILTSLSLSAVATNMRVKGGGDYYLISRTLGLEFGGSIGLVLFLAQSVSIGFYLIGFGEALSWLLPQSFWTTPQILALAAEELDLDAEPEEGPAAEAAEIRSRVEEMTIRFNKSSEELARSKKSQGPGTGIDHSQALWFRPGRVGREAG
jgi:hypothetical protein